MWRTLGVVLALTFLGAAARADSPPFDAGLVLTISSFLGGDGEDAAVAAAVDASGHLVLAGSTCGKEFPWTVDLRSKPGGCDIFVVEVARDGSRILFAAVIGGSSADEVADVYVDGAIYNDAPRDGQPTQAWAAGRATLAVPFR